MILETEFFKRKRDELASMWQVRALRESKDLTRAILLAALIAEVPTAVPVLLRVAFPGFHDIALPQLTGYAWVIETGRVLCNYIDKNGVKWMGVVADSQEELRGKFRRLADDLKLTDPERMQMFMLLQKWVTADHRVDHLGRRVH